MQIFIPTYGRAEGQETLRQLLRAGLRPALVVQAREVSEYARRYKDQVRVIELPASITSIAPTRQYILEHLASGPFCMVDDDLYFYKRRDDNRQKLRDITPEELAVAFDRMGAKLYDFPHVGFAAREGANHNVEGYARNTRIMRVLGYNAEVLKSKNIRFDEMEVMEDFHVALSLLKWGYQNLVINDYAHNQAGGSAAEGGCSHFRTPELQARNAYRLAMLHPGFVKVTEKTTKSAWGGGTRTDVTVYWKKAYESHRS